MSAKPPRVIRWRKAAGDDLAAIVDHIAADSISAAEKFLGGILSRISALEWFPYSGAVCPHYPKARQLIYGNYIVYYSVGRNEVLIRAVVHGARLFQASWLRRR
jgi:plasmid stabilization system protein ParE